MSTFEFRRPLEGDWLQRPVHGERGAAPSRKPRWAAIELALETALGLAIAMMAVWTIS